MRSPDLINCSNCKVGGQQGFCEHSVRLLPELHQLKSAAMYPAKAQVFCEGQRPSGTFVLCTGTAKLSTTSQSGRSIITRICHPPAILGLNAVIVERPYEATAEMIVRGQVCFIPRDALLRAMNEDVELALKITEQISSDYYTAHRQVRLLGLATQPLEKLAKFLLCCFDGDQDGDSDGGTSIDLGLTHEEIGETIGSCRETVTRLFWELREKRLVQSEGSTLAITDRDGLERLVQF